MGNTSHRAGNMIGIADDVKMYQCIRLITLMLNLFTIISWLRFSVRFHHCFFAIHMGHRIVKLDIHSLRLCRAMTPKLTSNKTRIEIHKLYIENQSVPCKTST